MTRGASDFYSKIQELLAIRDLTWVPRSLIQNPCFLQDWTGWVLTGGTVTVQNGYMRFYAGKYGAVEQYFPIALDPTWWSWFDVRTYGAIGAQIKVDFILRTYAHEPYLLTKTKSGFETFTLTPTSPFVYLQFYHYDTNPYNFDIYELNMGF